MERKVRVSLAAQKHFIAESINFSSHLHFADLTKVAKHRIEYRIAETTADLGRRTRSKFSCTH